MTCALRFALICRSTLTTFLLYEGRLSRTEVNDGCTFACEGQPPSATVSYNADKRLAILNPDANMQGNTTYTAVVEGADDSDGKAVKDLGGTPMARDYIFHFTTGSACDIFC